MREILKKIAAGELLTPIEQVEFTIHFYETLSGVSGRAKQLPGWALLLRSPDRSSEAVSSWLGGLPKIPSGFEWPRDVDGSPQHFMAQIDLASLKPEPITGSRPPGLPAQGAMLVFVGISYTCRLLTRSQVEGASPAVPPHDLPSMLERGFFGEGRTFDYWPVDAIAYLDTDGGRPSFMHNHFARPESWISTWGLAALEAEAVIQYLEREVEWGLRNLATDNPERSDRRSVEMREYAQMITTKGKEVLLMLGDWRNLASSRLQGERVEERLLQPVLKKRLELSDAMPEDRSPIAELRGSPELVWERIRRAYPSILRFGSSPDLPAAYRQFVHAMITDWRGHRLFGLQRTPPLVNEDLRGQNCLINVFSDDLLGTKSGHSYSMSVWCDARGMEQGKYDNGQFIRHHKG